MFAISHHGKGFNMKFPNGFSLSVQFSEFNYCDRRTYEPFENKEDGEHWESETAEIAIIYKGNLMNVFEAYKLGDEMRVDSVKGWVDTSYVAEIINIVSKASTQEEVFEGVKNIKSIKNHV